MIRSKQLYIYYYPLMMAVYLLSLFFPAVVRPGVCSAVLILILWAERFLHLRERDRAGTEDIVMTVWLLYNILSGIWTVRFGMPFSVYAGELFSTALPMVFYYCGRYSKDGADGDRAGFYRLFSLSTALMGLLGVILFITAPKFYIDFLYRLEYISKADVSTMHVRMHSLIGSTLTGYLSAMAMAADAFFLGRILMGTSGASGRRGTSADQDGASGRRGTSADQDAASGRTGTPAEKTGAVKGRLVFWGSLFFLHAFLAFMSNQRAAMVAVLLLVLYMNYLLFFVFRLLPMKYFRIECAALAAGFAALLLLFHGAFMKVYYRLVSLPGAIAERSDQWVGAANNMADKWIGNGLGANGHRAAEYTKHMIADGGIAKLYCESGIIGFSLFLFLMLLIFRKGRRHLLVCAPEMGILFVTLLMCAGSNLMSFALSVPVFYYAAGAAVGAYSTQSGESPRL